MKQKSVWVTRDESEFECEGTCDGVCTQHRAVGRQVCVCEQRRWQLPDEKLQQPCSINPSERRPVEVPTTPVQLSTQVLQVYRQGVGVLQNKSTKDAYTGAAWYATFSLAADPETRRIPSVCSPDCSKMHKSFTHTNPI